MASWKIEALRKEMASLGVDAIVVPSTDPHQSEYVPAQWQRRAFASGFTGSAGDLVVTQQDAALWTDSRYYLQAESQLRGTGVRLCKQGLPGTPSIQAWLRDTLPAGAKVGVDLTLISVKTFNQYQKVLGQSDIAIAPVAHNPVDTIWEDRPEPPLSAVSVWPDELAGQSVREKLDALRLQMQESHASAHVIAPLDAIAWLFNIRGQDVPFNPVVIAYAIVTQADAHLFMDMRQVSEMVRSHLEDVAIHPYSEFGHFLEILGESDESVLIDPDTTNRWIVSRLGKSAACVFKQSPIALMKATKNRTELTGIQAAHLRDGVAMVTFLSWLDTVVPSKNLTEITAAEKLGDIRARGDRYMGPSFGTISAFGANGAIVHYEVSPHTNVPLDGNNLYLVDSGGQYLDGTTDITRTIAVGTPSTEQQECFTLVLKGHINLAMTSFPKGTSGSQLDTIARKPLWDAGLNYGHGTGHGVGAYLNVHEGPHAISYYRGFGVSLMEGMVLSIEPGFYKHGAFGIRIENLVSVVKSECLTNGETTFLTFEPLSLCPIDRRLVLSQMLDDNERAYLDKYHRRVRQSLSPHVSGTVLEWLIKATAPLETAN